MYGTILAGIIDIFGVNVLVVAGKMHTGTTNLFWMREIPIGVLSLSKRLLGYFFT